MKRALGIVFAVFLLAIACLAQDAQPDNSPASKADVEQLFITLHLHEMMQDLMATSMQQSKQLAHETLKKKQPGISDEELKRLDGFIDDLTKTLDINGMLDDMVPVYEHHLSKQDVQAMLAFYKSPTGQKILREQPAMMAEGMQAMQPRMRKMMGDVMDKAEKLAREDASKAMPAQQ
ncbi:MAG TPA: DUF2059 domain-containing protein [Terriglobales bacterium]|nr:DUF2059 domain-containing protein [Terriglobales bacterium]